MPATNKKTIPAAKPDNYEIFMKMLAVNELNLRQLADLTGYSYETLRGFSMPDRTSVRARRITERCVEFINMKLLASGLKAVSSTTE